MPQFTITISPSTTPEVTQNPPERCKLALMGSLNALGVHTSYPNGAMVTGYFRIKEGVPEGLYRAREIEVTAIGEDITVDFYWPHHNTGRRALAHMYIDFYEPPEPCAVKSTLRINSWESGQEGEDLIPRLRARLLEKVEIPLYNSKTQYLMIDDPIEYGYTSNGGLPYTDEPAHGGKYVGDIVLERQLDANRGLR